MLNFIFSTLYIQIKSQVALKQLLIYKIVLKWKIWIGIFIQNKKVQGTTGNLKSSIQISFFTDNNINF
jgi:hypothetical protein